MRCVWQALLQQRLQMWNNNKFYRLTLLLSWAVLRATSMLGDMAVRTPSYSTPCTVLTSTTHPCTQGQYSCTFDIGIAEFQNMCNSFVYFQFVHVSIVLKNTLQQFWRDNLNNNTQYPAYLQCATWIQNTNDVF